MLNDFKPIINITNKTMLINLILVFIVNFENIQENIWYIILAFLFIMVTYSFYPFVTRPWTRIYVLFHAILEYCKTQMYPSLN